jgi:hypothetical protein
MSLRILVGDDVDLHSKRVCRFFGVLPHIRGSDSKMRQNRNEGLTQ